jgi:LPS-assembly protein
MSKRSKVRAKLVSAGLVFAIVFLITHPISAKYQTKNKNQKTASESSDTIPPKKQQKLADTTKAKRNTQQVSTDTTRKNLSTSPIDTARIKGDTSLRDSLGRIIVTDTLKYKLSQDSLDAPVTYSAQDSGVLDIPAQIFILYGKGNTKYSDIDISAATIKLDQGNHKMYAYGSTDTSGNPMDKPKLVQADMTSYSDTIVFDTKSQKGLIKSTYLQQGEMYVFANTIKKVTNDVLYAYRGRFTTCNLDTPHFAFRTKKMKIINNKLAVSGPTFPEFEGVPLPIGIPFGIFPLNRGRHSGFLTPTFEANEDFGLGLVNGGFYKVINDNMDVTIRSNLYSYGGYTLNGSSKYLKRYRYNGGFNLAYQHTKILNRSGTTKEEFTQNNSFMINWSHSRDSRARPGTNFSASVNAGSTKFNRYVSNNPQVNFNNQLSSSINYTKDWNGKYNLSVNANHNQNNVTRLINLNLPTVNFSAVTFYPFQRKEQVGEAKWYEKLGIAYTGNIQNQVAFYDSAINIRRILDTAQWGATHNIPISLSLPSLGPIQVSPSVSYEERWYGQKIERSWNREMKKVDTAISRGFYAARQMQFGVSASTRIFGTYQFGKNSKINAIRHEIRPTFSVNYKPDFMKKYFYDLQVDTTGRNFFRFSQFDGGLNGTFSEGSFGGIGFGIDNTLEMKVRDKNDTTEGAMRKVKLLDGFGFSGSYNLVADSFRMSPLSFYLRSNLFEKINITASATLDPYEIDARGFRRDQLLWSGTNFSLGRITNGSIAVSTSLRSKTKDGKTPEDRIQQDEYMTPDEQQSQLDMVRNNPAEYTDFNIPWSLQLSYSLNFSRQFVASYTNITTQVYSNVSINGDFSLTARWKIGGSTYYDFTTAKIQTLSMFISREMHCWQMAINLNPIGLYRSFNISISPKSGILRDLKINRSRSFITQ